MCSVWRQKQWFKYFYIKGLCACEFEDVNERMFNAQMCHNTKWPLRQVPTTVHNVVTVSHDITSTYTGWVLTNEISISLSEAVVSHRRERLPYPCQKRVADSSSSLLGCCLWLMQKSRLADELVQLHFLVSPYFAMIGFFKMLIERDGKEM